MTTEDKRFAIMLALKEWGGEGGKSSRDIADQIGCSDRYVGMIQSEVRSTSHLSDSEHPRTRVTGKDGKSYPAQRKSNEVKMNPLPFERFYPHLRFCRQAGCEKPTVGRSPYCHEHRQLKLRRQQNKAALDAFRPLLSRRN